MSVYEYQFNLQFIKVYIIHSHTLMSKGCFIIDSWSFWFVTLLWLFVYLHNSTHKIFFYTISYE